MKLFEVAVDYDNGYQTTLKVVCDTIMGVDAIIQASIKRKSYTILMIKDCGSVLVKS